jgi:transglutaminase-like putative cysteine protease
MKNITLKLSILCLLLSSLSAFTAPEPPPKAEKTEKAEKAPKTIFLDKSSVLKKAAEATVKKFPDADSVLVGDYEKKIYQPDGTSESWDEVYEKVLTEKGKRDNRILTLYFTIPYSKVDMPLLELIKPNGTVQKIDVKKNSREMVNPSQMNQNIYNPNSKLLKITIPGLEIGDVIHSVSHRQTVKARVPKTWSDYFVLEYTNPIMDYDIEIDAPKSMPLVNIQLKDEIKGTVKFSQQEKGDRIIYKWHASDIPRIFEEPSMPPYYTVTQRLLVSTIPNWQYISKWYWELSKPHLDKITPEIKAKVAELTKGIKDKNKQIEAIFQYVSQKIRYMGITTEKVAPGYEPHDVDITFNNKYGVCRDKAALLTAMLRAAGFKAFPVLIHNGPKKDKEVPQPYFNHAITCVEKPDGTYELMDSTDESTTDMFPAYLCNQSYLVAKPEGENLQTSPIIPAEKNLINIKTTATLDTGNNLKATTVLTFNGINDGAYRGYFSRIKPEQRRQFFEGRLKTIVAGTKLEDLKIEPANLRDMSKPLTVSFSFTAPAFLIKGDQNLMLPLPWMGTSFGIVNFILGRTGLEKRRFPLLTEIACGAQESFELDLKDSTGKILCLPKYKTLKNQSMLWKQSLKLADHKLTGKSKFLINTVEFSPKDYLELKSSLKKIEYNRRKMPIFTTPKNNDSEYKNADAIILDEKVEIEIVDKQNLKIIKKVKKKILTYAGKKANSELKISYNPVWENVKLTAKVTTASGEVKTLAKEELNLMDAGWTGSAPRYPPGKTLVASFPAVDVGCVIEYQIETQLSKQPFMSTMGYFRYNNPLKSKSISLKSKDICHYHLFNDDNITFRHEKKDGYNYYYWETANQPAVKQEPSMPVWWSFNPTLLISSETWKDYSQTLLQELQKRTDKQEQTKQKALSLIKGQKTPSAKIVAIRDYIEENIRPAGPGINSLPLSCLTPADTTLKDGYGNNPDQAILYYTMLKTAGFKPEFILGSSYPPLKAITFPLIMLPQRFLFNNLLVKVKVGDQDIYLNDTSQYAKLGTCSHANRLSLNLQNGETTPIKVAAEMDNKNEIRYEMKIDNSGKTVIARLEYYYGDGYEGFHRRFAEMTPEKRKRYFQELISGISQAAKPVKELSTDYKKYPGTEAFVISVENYAVKEGRFLYFKLPGNILKNIIRLHSDKRESPYYMGGRLDFSLNYAIELPAEVESISMLPPELDINLPKDGGKIQLTSKYQSDKSRRQLNINCQVQLYPSIFSTYEYQDLLTISSKLSHPSMNMVLCLLKPHEPKK